VIISSEATNVHGQLEPNFTGIIFVRSSTTMPHFIWIQQKNISIMDSPCIRLAEISRIFPVENTVQNQMLPSTNDICEVLYKYS